jgi:hypothetical protein
VSDGESRDLNARRRSVKYRFALGFLFGFFAVIAYARNARNMSEVDWMAVFGFSLLSVFQFVRGWLQRQQERS